MMFKRLMEIKEMQLEHERRTEGYIMAMDETLTEILKELKGRLKDGKDKNKRN